MAEQKFAEYITATTAENQSKLQILADSVKDEGKLLRKKMNIKETKTKVTRKKDIPYLKIESGGQDVDQMQRGNWQKIEIARKYLSKLPQALSSL